MKTPSKILVAALFGVALTVGAFAGPGFQYWQTHGAAAKSSSDVAVTKPAATANGVTCATMMEPKARLSRETTTAAIVTCTPETLKNNPRCAQACGM